MDHSGPDTWSLFFFVSFYLSLPLCTFSLSVLLHHSFHCLTLSACFPLLLSGSQRVHSHSHSSAWSSPVVVEYKLEWNWFICHIFCSFRVMKSGDRRGQRSIVDPCGTYTIECPHDNDNKWPERAGNWTTNLVVQKRQLCQVSPLPFPLPSFTLFLFTSFKWTVWINQKRSSLIWQEKKWWCCKTWMMVVCPVSSSQHRLLGCVIIITVFHHRHHLCHHSFLFRLN